MVRELRLALDALRDRIKAGQIDEADLAPAAILARVEASLARRSRPYYHRVLNATGVVLHTNLGRAPLAPEAVRALAETAGGAQRLELDPETGQRGGREAGCVAPLRELLGCEDACVVNNNAAATLLMLAALARGRRVVVSRGELVEIGGSYRIPDVMAESGAILCEVGTTNRTHRADYARALAEHDDVALLLKVHTSNYRVLGFTAEVDIAELVALGRERGVPVLHDLGSGSLIDLARFGVRGEPTVARSLAAGVDLACFSGDKLLGGPQCGILAGTAEAVERCRRQPLFRALRPGRMVYAALEATLRLYLDGEERAREAVPALARLTAPPEVLRRRAAALARRIANSSRAAVQVVRCTSQAGSGALPLEELPSWGVEVRVEGLSADELAHALRTGDPAVLPRVADDAVRLDVRTLAENELPELVRRIAEISPFIATK